MVPLVTDAGAAAGYAGLMPASAKQHKAKRVSELELIRSIRSRAARLQAGLGGRAKTGILSLGIGDDCAVLRPRRKEDLLVTTDLSLEDVHFRRAWHPPPSIGHRCLARGLSDLAAMGARPEVAFLSLALPSALTGSWLQGFLQGWMALAERHGVLLAGGDMAKSPTGTGGSLVVADIVLLGSVPRGKALLRSGAQAGDIIYVTGALGGSAAELAAIARRPAAFRGVDQAGHPQLYPEPRLTVGRKLMRNSLATAAIDLSDGLSVDLAHVCDESGLAAEIDVEALPVDARATLDQALHGGEDYELLFTASKKTVLPAQIGGVLLHPVGRMKKRVKGPQVVLIQGAKRTQLHPGGWEHFR